MKNLKTEFNEEIAAFEDVFWEMAESVGYQRSEESALLLIRVGLPFFLKDNPKEFLTMLEKFPRRDGTVIENALGRAFLECVFAKRQSSIRFLSASQRSLGAARTLLSLQTSMNSVLTHMESFEKTLKEVSESSVRRKEDLISRVLSDFGRKGAAAAHVETNKMKEEVVEHWSLKIDKSLSNEKAATELLKQFPLSHRTLREYVAEAKRNMRPAGKALHQAA